MSRPKRIPVDVTEPTLPNCFPVDWVEASEELLYALRPEDCSGVLAIVLELNERLQFQALTETTFAAIFMSKFLHNYTYSPDTVIQDYAPNGLTEVDKTALEFQASIPRLFYRSLAATRKTCGDKIPHAQYFTVALICTNNECLKYSFNLHNQEMRCEHLKAIAHLKQDAEAKDAQLSRVWVGFSCDDHPFAPMFELQYVDEGRTACNNCDKLRFNSKINNCALYMKSLKSA